MPNPFYYENPVSADQFLDRRQELRRITGRIANQGQSTAIVGEPRSYWTKEPDLLSPRILRRHIAGQRISHLTQFSGRLAGVPVGTALRIRRTIL